MNSKFGNKLLTEILNIKGTKVISKRQHEGIGIILQVEPLNKESICPHCGTLSYRLHQNHRYLIKDLPLSGQPVYLEINRRQFKCDSCRKPFSEELDFVKKKRSYTSRLASDIVQQVLENNIKTVTERSHVTTEEIETMLKDASEEFLKSKPSELKRLGIDEIAWVKGQANYCAVLIDLDSCKLIGILNKRTQAHLREVLIQWGAEILEQIEEVSIDLWKAYKTLVEELMPNAQVVADRFHVIKQVNDELDRQRKQEKRQAEKEKNQSKKEEFLAALNKSKYTLLKNEESLTESQLLKLEQVKLVFPGLGLMHKLKEDFRNIFEKNTDWLSGLFSIGKWLNSAAQYFPESHKTIKRWLDEIIAYFDNRTTSGVVEGINNKIKLILRTAYGFRNFDNFRVRCLLSWHFSC